MGASSKSQLTKLEIGCGADPTPGYLHTDWYISDYNRKYVDVACDVREPLPFKAGRFEDVLMYGVFEHFSYHEASQVLINVARVLRVGGVLKFDVPDFDWFIRMYLNPAGLDPCRTEEWILQGIYGGQALPGHYHLWGWNEKRLRKFLEASKLFSAIEMVGKQWRDPEENHLIWTCTK